ncbi:hypothetical protein EKO27_g2735 [Xylaria grammica]|uniref:chitinase n=1 Tax=Xylaria grammica TaxID=363999 RepID=A0A439DD56_9PEZI|nr:hypothetical protein EKO27_g2735 [Xylaria grammica]
MSFNVVPGHSDDIEIYREFTALKSSTLQTWVAIGGWSFNDPGPTRNTFSNLARTSQGRATFIASLASFLEEYGFQGVDIDWEYPGAPDRGGIQEDTDNYVSLVKELRDRLGTRFGISIAIPTSYWYLRWFKPKQMEPYVDWFGVMTYDLHGPWDEAVRQIGRVILGHTNIPEIANWTLPLYYDGVSPAKLNMGLAYYARGYTATDANCNTIGCNWAGESRPAACTNFAGVMSLQEVERLMKEEGVQSRLLAREMMKELTFGDQWIGYDDLETIRMKKEWASRRCFGGTMIWSVDMYSGSGSGDVPDGNGSTSPGDPGSGMGEGSSQIFIDPSIWNESTPEIRCQPPCTFILPPTRLPTETTISFPPYTTSLDVAWSESGTWTSIVQTTILTIPPVVTTEIEVWGYTISDTRTATSPQSGVSHSPVTRTITPPPYPYTFTPPGGQGTRTTSSSTNVLPIFPIVTWKPGRPGPICKSNCGRPCRLFCNSPCLLGCKDGGADFADPGNPKPPGRPTPTPGPDPHPPGTPTRPPVPPDPEGTKPQNEEQEEDDQNCALELGQPLPTYRPPSTTSIVKPPPPPSPSPEPPEEPPGPNRDTEQVSCYDSGQRISRALCIEALEYFCDDYEGVVLDATRPGTRRTLSNNGYGVQCIGEHGSIGGCFVLVQISVTVKNDCRFTVGGKGPRAECGRIIRRIIDECDTSSTEWKQGGTLESNCASWRFDPNANW